MGQNRANVGHDWGRKDAVRAILEYDRADWKDMGE